MNIEKVNEWLENHGYDCQAISGEEFQYLTLEDEDGDGVETIVIAKNNPKDEDLRRVCSKFGVELTEENLRVFCFLHELGHYNTIEDYTWFSLLAHSILMYIIPNVKLFDKLSEYIHHRFDFEIGATEWACEYMLAHPRITKQLGYII